MHIVIINGATRPQAKSNTAKILAAFQKGYEESGNTTEIHHLSDRRQWAAAERSFQENTNILIALPLYVENIPGILLEFLSGLQQKKKPGTKLSFLLQGGFPEASQSRCCEAFLETLPAQLGCEYVGTLIKGDMFGLSLVGEKTRKKMLTPFTQMGRVFARDGCFKKKIVDTFAAPEYLHPPKMRMFNLFGKHLARIFMPQIAKKLGCKERLDATPLRN